MTSLLSDDTRSARRAAIEEEVRQRLAADQIPPREVPQAAVSSVQLRCQACRAVSPADAQFCTQCGVRFNALVVPAPGGASS
ncbi:MAG: hypothetical protein ABL961_16130 [Vicinamibacterales bacterium]